MEAAIQIPSDTEIEQSISGPMWLDKNGIIVTINKGEKEHTLEHAKHNMATVDKISKGVQHPLLVDFTNVRHVGKEAREYYTSKECSKKVTAVGIISNSNIGRMVANFVLSINKSHIPVRFFNSYDDALQWLKQYI